MIRAWSDAADDDGARRRIAGITGRGGTLLAPVLTSALAALRQRTEQMKWLILALDGELDADDTGEVRALLPGARRANIHVQPVFLGTDAGVIQTVQGLFGSCLEAPTPAGLAGRLSRLDPCLPVGQGRLFADYRPVAASTFTLRNSTLLDDCNSSVPGDIVGNAAFVCTWCHAQPGVTRNSCAYAWVRNGEPWPGSELFQ